MPGVKYDNGDGDGDTADAAESRSVWPQWGRRTHGLRARHLGIPVLLRQGHVVPSPDFERKMLSFRELQSCATIPACGPSVVRGSAIARVPAATDGLLQSCCTDCNDTLAALLLS